jgi:hypothetical protein
MAALALSGCVQALGDGDGRGTALPVPLETVTASEALFVGAAPPVTERGACYARNDAPADVAREPAPGGAAAAWFRTLCPEETDAAFVASLQRALAARGFYRGAVTGRFDDATRIAIADYQRPLGLRSGVPSVAAARTLGLEVWTPGASLWD